MGELVSLAKPIVLCTTRKRILCWTIFTVEPIADFCPILGYWPSKHESREFASLVKPIVLCTTEKRILRWSIFAVKPIADFCPFFP